MAKEKNKAEFTLADKVAVILYTLGEESASQVMSYMEHDDVRELSKSMISMKNISSKDVDAIIDEFHARVSNKEGTIVSIEKDYVKSVITNVVGEKTAERILESISLEGDGSYIEIFRNLDIRVLAEFIKNEHPQTIALIISQLLPEKASEVMLSLPDNLQLDVIDRMSKLENISSERLRDIAHVLESEIKTAQTTTKQMGGVKSISEILNNMDREASSAILVRIEENDPEMAEKIRQNMFFFEGLIKVDDKGIQGILKEISTDILSKAMKTVSDAIKEKIFKNMSERAAYMLKEDIEEMGPTRLADIEKAQNEIVKVATKLADEGKIFIAGGKEDDVFV